jgi:hypothetical protein
MRVPIIEQDVVRVDHRHSVDDLTRVGADIERAVLSPAVWWHGEGSHHRIRQPHHRLLRRPGLCHGHAHCESSTTQPGV